MSPQWFLVIMLTLTLGAYGFHRVVRSRNRHALRKLAGSQQMQYVQEDLFNLGKRIVKNWPIPDCSEFRPLDLVYGSNAGQHRFIFTVHFTLGPLDGYRRDLRVVTFAESCDSCCDMYPTLTFADRDGCLLDQYKSLIKPERS